MDAQLYKEAIEYELLVQVVYQAILQQEGVENIEVQHNTPIRGRSGVEHQIDVYWEFRQAGINHKVLIECKNYSSNLSLEKARNFFAVIHDIGNAQGLIVTKTGFQSGAAEFCQYYGIGAKLLRKSTDKDWEGRVKKIHINIVPRVPASTDEKPITLSMYLRPCSDEQESRLNNAVTVNPQLVEAGPSFRFIDSNKNFKTEEMRWWVPKQLDVLNYEDGGPYTKKIELNNHYVLLNLGEGEELVQVIGVVIEFYVETLESEEIIMDASHTIEAILKDFQSGEVEHIHKSK